MKNIKQNAIVGIIITTIVVLIFNKILILSAIIIGITGSGYAAWKFILKDKFKQLNDANQKLLDLNEENRALKERVEDYSKRKLNISQINTAMELGLFEVETNFKRTINKRFKIEERTIKFVGVVDVDFIAKYGIDLKKIKYQINEESKELLLTNTKPEFIAFTQRRTKWEIDEILEYNTPLIGSPHWRTNAKLDKLADKIKEEIRHQVEQDSENGPEELKWIIEPLRNHVERALKLILGNQGYKLRFTEIGNGEFKSFDEFDELNRKKQLI